MSKGRSQVEFPFPLGGYDSNWAYAKQPDRTSPSMSNVRAYSTDERRARGGSRPGVTLAYDEQIGGGGAVQWLGWMDTGFGDSAVYRDGFHYADGQLSTRTGSKWPSANAYLHVKDGYVHLDSLQPACASGTHADIGSDTWDDFTMQARIEWTYGATGSVMLDSNDGGGAGSGGAAVTVAYSSTEIAWPGLGYTGSLSIQCVSGSASAVWSKAWGPFFSVAGGTVRVEADRDTVRVFWGDAQIIEMARDDGTCDTVGFSIAAQNDTTRLPDAAIDIRMHELSLTAATRPTETARKLVVIGGRDLWHESSEGELAAITTGSTFADVSLVSATSQGGNLFIVDGTAPRVYRSVSGTVSDWAAVRGEIVRNVTLAASWRNRVVLARSVDDPQNYYMSRQDDPWDFDYGQDDAQSAVAGSFSDAGRIGDPIQALCPVSDDVMIIGCTGSIWRLRGDPAQGGWAEKVADDIGIVGQNAWTLDPSGRLYFLSDEGLCRMTARGKPENLSRGRIAELSGCRAIQPGSTAAAGEQYLSVAYDAQRHGILVFAAPFSASSAVHYFYDLRLDALFPETYPVATGPTCAVFYSARGAAARRLLLGGRQGYLCAFDDAANDDTDIVAGQPADVAVASHVWTRPQRLATQADRDAILVSLRGALAAGSDDVAYSVHAAETAEAVLDAAASVTGTWSAGWNRPDRTRTRGGVHAIKLANTALGVGWAVESIVGEVVEGGQQR